MKCENFCNGHCCTSDCPSIQCDDFEDWYNLPASDAGLERIDCKDCAYNDANCDCNDCYLHVSEYCRRTKNEVDSMITITDITSFLWEIARDYKTPLGLEMTFLAIHMIYDGRL